MADFATTLPEEEKDKASAPAIESKEQGQELLGMLERGEVPANKVDAAWQALEDHRKQEMGVAPVSERIADAVFGVFTPDPNEFGETMQAPGKEFGRQLGSTAKGVGKVAYDTALFGLDVAEFFLPDMPGFIQANDVALKLRAQAKAARKLFGEDMDQMIYDISEQESSPVGEFVGTLAPFMVLPYQLSTYTRTVLANGVVGGFAGAILDRDANNFLERLGEAKTGALWGLGFSAALSAKQGFQAYSSRKFMKAFDEEYTKNNLRLERELQRLGITDDAGNPITLSLGELTADPFITGLTVSSAHTMARDIQNSKIRSLLTFLEKRSASYADDASSFKIATDLNETIVRLSNEIKKGSQAQYGASMGKLIDEMGDDAALSFSDARGYLEKAQELAGRAADPREFGHAAAVPKGLQAHIDFLDVRLNPLIRRRVQAKDGTYTYQVIDRVTGAVEETFKGRGSMAAADGMVRRLNLERGKLTTEDVAATLVGHTKLVGGELSVFETAALGSDRNLGSALKASMIESLEATNSASNKRLLDIRETYANEQRKLFQIRRTLLGRLFESEDGYVSTQHAVDALVGRTQKELIDTRNLLELHAPDMVDDMKSYIVARVVDRAQVPSERMSLEPVSLTKLADSLAGTESRKVGEIGLGFFTPAEQAELRAVGTAVRVLQETHQPNFSFASVTETGNVLINAFSRSPEFLARQLGRMFGQSDVITRMLNDPMARQSLITLSKQGVNGAKGRAALAALLYIEGETAGMRKIEEERALKQQALEETGRSGSARLLDE